MKLTIIAHKILNFNLLNTITTIYLPKTIKTTNSYLMANIMRAIIKMTTKMELNIMIKRSRRTTYRRLFIITKQKREARIKRRMMRIVKRKQRKN
jgi:hypothetical protein